MEAEQEGVAKNPSRDVASRRSKRLSSTPAEAILSREDVEAIANENQKKELLKLLPGGHGGRLSSVRGGDSDEWSFHRKRLKLSPGDTTKDATKEAPQDAADNATNEKTKEAPAGDATDDEMDDETPTVNLIHFPTLKEQMTNVLACKTCGSDVEVTNKSVGVAATMQIKCSSVSCNMNANINPVTREGKAGKSLSRNDCVINQQLIVAHIASGSGGRDAAKLLGLLDLPNARGMAKSSFSHIEKEVGAVIQRIVNEALDEALHNEVRATLDEVPQEGLTANMWKDACKNGTSLDEHPQITGSVDMGWQARHGGRRHASLSGHAFIVGGRTRKPVAMKTLCKNCATCNKFRDESGDMPDDANIPKHHCPINCDGHSKSMESYGAARLCEFLHKNKKVSLSCVVADDDSTLRAQLKWSIQDKIDNGRLQEWPKVANTKGKLVKVKCTGKLECGVPEPSFLSDPSHRRRIFSDDLHSLKKKGKKESSMTDCDMLRLVKNFGHMRTQLLDLPEEKWADAAKAALEHHFDNHEFCGGWCKRKTETAEEKAKTAKRHRNEEIDPVLHEQLKELLKRFITVESLRQICHGYNTQPNEAHNQMIAWCAPKNRTHSQSMSLRNRTSMATGIAIHGCGVYFRKLFEELGMPFPNGTKKWLESFSNERETKLKKQKLVQNKIKRRKRHYQTLKKHTETFLKSKHDGDYGRGIGFATTNEPEVDTEATGNRNEELVASTTRKQSAAKASKICNSCQRAGHKTWRSKNCLNHSKYLQERMKTKKGSATADDKDGGDHDGGDNKNLEKTDDVIGPHELQPAEINFSDSDECELLDKLPLGDEGDDDRFKELTSMDIEIDTSRSL